MSDSRINADSYIVVQGWMITELNLKGNELLVFAIIHGFSQDNAGEFTGSLQYLADWTNSSRRTVISSLTSLTNKKLIEKKEEYTDNVKFCRYKCKIFTSGEKTSSGVVKKFHRGVVKKLHLINYLYIT